MEGDFDGREESFDEPAEEKYKVLKKIYFIKEAEEGEELITLLKNKFKTIDAIKDLIGWLREGRDFTVVLKDWSEEDATSESTVRVSQWFPTAENHRNVIDTIARIISWLDLGKPFDITLTPKRSFEINLN